MKILKDQVQEEGKRNRSNGSNITTDNNLNIPDKSPEKPDTKSSQNQSKQKLNNFITSLSLEYYFPSTK